MGSWTTPDLVIVCSYAAFFYPLESMSESVYPREDYSRVAPY